MGESCLYIKKIEPKDEKGTYSFSSPHNRSKWLCWRMLGVVDCGLLVVTRYTNSNALGGATPFVLWGLTAV